jgi:transposase-like protein
MTPVQALIEQLQGRGWTVAGLARELDVAQTTIYRWRRGNTIPRNVLSVMMSLRQLLEQTVPTLQYQRRKTQR